MSKTILIIDDSRLTRMMISKIVQQAFPDWTIEEAADGLEAIKKARAGEIDVITVDMNMPGIDGLYLAPDLREYCPDARIAMISANIQKAVRERAEELGLEFIRKPIDSDRILEFLKDASD